MATRKFITLDEAAQMIGVSPDALNEMRERQKIYGYRDGGSWKFKAEDVEKLIADRASAEEEGDFAEMDEDPDSILLSEVELGGSDESTSSTIIGGRPSPKPSAESDIQLAPPKGEESALELDRPKHDSDVLSLDLGSGSKAGSDVLKEGSGVSPMFDELDALDLEMESAASSGISSKALSGSSLDLGKQEGTSDIALGSDALKLEGSGLNLAESGVKLEGSGLKVGGDEELSLGEAPGLELSDPADGGSAIDLTGDDDGELVLGASSHGGDLSRAGDSGISLLDPADSGLSLESPPLQLGGSAVEQLELGEEEPSAEEPAAKTQIGEGAQSDDDFLLTPLEEAGAEDSSDSGSQVIALEDADVEFTEEGEEGAMAGAGLLEEDLGEGLGGGGLGAPALTSAAAQSAVAAPAAGATMTVPDVPFSGWNVLSLVMCTLLLMLIGMFMFDLLRNMWSWNGPYSVNSSMMDMILSWFEK